MLWRSRKSASTLRAIILILFLLPIGSALGSIIVNYSVQPWNSPPVETPGLSTNVGAFSGALTLTTGVPQTAVLYPLTVTLPDDFRGQFGSLSPVIAFSFMDTVSGQPIAYLKVPVLANYEIFPAYVIVRNHGLGPAEFMLGTFGLRIDMGQRQFLGTPVIGGSATFDVNAAFTMLPAPEPPTVSFLLVAAAFCAIQYLRHSNRERSAHVRLPT